MFGFLLAHYPVNNLGNRLIGKCNEKNTKGMVLCRLQLQVENRALTKKPLVTEKLHHRAYTRPHTTYLAMSGRGYHSSGYHDNGHSSHRGGQRGRGSSYRGGYKGTRYDPYYNSRHNSYPQEREHTESYDSRDSREHYDSRETHSSSFSGESHQEAYDSRPSLARYRGSNYRGSNYRGNNFRGGYSSRGGHPGERGSFLADRGSFLGERGSFLAEKGPRNGSFTETHSTPRENVSRPTVAPRSQDPWTLILRIRDEKTQARLDATHALLGAANRQLVELQKERLRLETAVAHLERNALKEALNVQLTHDKLEEFAFL